MQELDANPATGDYAFGGILVYESTAPYEYYQGDLVEIGGQIDEYFGLTEMIPHNGNAVNLLGFGNDLPDAAVSRPASWPTTTRPSRRRRHHGRGLGKRLGPDLPSAVVDTPGFGEYIISDTGARADSLIVDPIAQLTYVPDLGDVVKVESYMDYAFGARASSCRSPTSTSS